MRRGLSLVDLLVAIGILSVAALISLPTLSTSERATLDGAANLLAADLEHAVALSVTEPSDPIVVALHGSGDGYHLARLSDPETPIERHENGQAWTVTFGEGGAALLNGVTLAPVGEFASLTYDSFGRLLSVVDREIALSNESGLLVVRVDADTGDVSVTRP